MQKCKTCEGEKDERKDDDDGKKGAWVYVVGGASNIVYCPSTATHITSVLPKAILHTHTFQEEHDGTHRTKEIWKNNKDSHSRVNAFAAARSQTEVCGRDGKRLCNCK